MFHVEHSRSSNEIRSISSQDKQGLASRAATARQLFHVEQ
jgi:hypothetical protein